MKFVKVLITFAICLSAIMESSYSFKCFQCTRYDNPGCDKTPVSLSFSRPCPTNCHRCVTYSHKENGVAVTDERLCLLDGVTARSDRVEQSFPCGGIENCNG